MRVDAQSASQVAGLVRVDDGPAPLYLVLETLLRVAARRERAAIDEEPRAPAPASSRDPPPPPAPDGQN